MLRLTHLVMQSEWSHCGRRGWLCHFLGTSLGGLTYSLHCAVPGGWGLMQTRSVGGAGVRWDVGDTGGLEGYEGLRGETDTRDSILALITPG